MTVVTHNLLTECDATRHLPFAGHGGVAERISRIVKLWRERRRERQTFHTFGHRELRELGASRWEVERELAKPFWRG